LKIILKEIRKHAQTLEVSANQSQTKVNILPPPNNDQHIRKTKGNKKTMIPMQSKFDFHASNGKAPEQCPSRSGQRRNKEEAVLQCFNRQGVNGITDHSSSWSWCPVSMQQPKLDGGSMIIGDNVLLKERCLHSNKCEYNNMFLLGRSQLGPITDPLPP
jgi:hypothetical protein